MSRREQFQIFIGGIPSSWTWEHLKDFVKNVTDRIRVDVFPYPCAAQGQWAQVGHVKVNGREDAQRLYNFLTTIVTDGHYFSVHAFDVTNGRKADSISCNCDQLGLNHLSTAAALSIYMQSMTPSPQIITVPSPPLFLPPLLLPPQLQYSTPDASFASVGSSAGTIQRIPCPSQSCYWAGPSSYGLAFVNAAAVTYPIGWNGSLINATKGVCETESRGIHISKLSYSAEDGDLKRLLENYGSVTALKIKLDSRGKSKGCAIAEFSSCEEAQHAIANLNGSSFMGRNIAVKRDCNVMPRGRRSSCPSHGPVTSPRNIVVNGSSPRRLSSV